MEMEMEVIRKWKELYIVVFIFSLTDDCWRFHSCRDQDHFVVKQTYPFSPSLLSVMSDPVLGELIASLGERRLLA